jgi:hypothetical protein
MKPLRDYRVTEIHYRPSEPQTFALTNSRDMLDKLKWEIDGLRAETGYPGWQQVAYRAFNCAITVLSLADWLWGDLSDVQKAVFGGKDSKFRAHCMTNTRALEICESLANSSKHRTRRAQLFNGNVATTTLAGVEPMRVGDRVGEPLAKWQWKPVVTYRGVECEALTIFEEAHADWAALIAEYIGEPA